MSLFTRIGLLFKKRTAKNLKPIAQPRTQVIFIAYRHSTDPLDDRIDLFNTDIEKCTRIMTTDFSISMRDFAGAIVGKCLSPDGDCLIICADIQDRFLDLFPAIGYMKNAILSIDLMQISLTLTPTDPSIGTLREQLEKQYCMYLYNGESKPALSIR